MCVLYIFAAPFKDVCACKGDACTWMREGEGEGQGEGMREGVGETSVTQLDGG